MARPLTPSDIQIFFDLAKYYRRFIYGFSSITSNLKTLTQNKFMFEWSESYERAFQEMSYKLTSIPVLTLQDGTERFVVYYDDSLLGLGCFIMKHGKVIVYASIQLKVHEKNSPTYFLELAVVVVAFKIWRLYI